MILLCLLLATYDSLPPLPDLARIEFPEPGLLPAQTAYGVRFGGHAGQFFGADVDLGLQNLSLAAAYSRINEWDTTDMGSASFSYRILSPGFRLRPRLRMDLVQREERHYDISPGIEFDLLSRSLVTRGEFDYNHWDLNNEIAREASGHILATFYRLSYMPQIELSGVYAGHQVKPSLQTQVNVGNFHLKLGSLVNQGFPSPHLSIAYATPGVRVSTAFSSGVRHTTLISFFDPNLPIVYPTSLPAETLSIAADVSFEVKILNHHFRVSGSYKEWLNRTDIGSEYMILQTKDIKESNLKLSARNTIPIEDIRFSNLLHVEYNTSDSALTFIPDYSITDTLIATFGIVELSANTRFLSERSGLEKSLPAYYIVNTSLGVRIFFAKLYLAINNLTDNRSEIYDNYFLTGRQYAGGIVINQRL